jgi:hypothetical protein
MNPALFPIAALAALAPLRPAGAEPLEPFNNRSFIFTDFPNHAIWLEPRR